MDFRAVLNTPRYKRSTSVVVEELWVNPDLERTWSVSTVGSAAHCLAELGLPASPSSSVHLPGPSVGVGSSGPGGNVRHVGTIPDQPQRHPYDRTSLNDHATRVLKAIKGKYAFLSDVKEPAPIDPTNNRFQTPKVNSSGQADPEDIMDFVREAIHGKRREADEISLQLKYYEEQYARLEQNYNAELRKCRENREKLELISYENRFLSLWNYPKKAVVKSSTIIRRILLRSSPSSNSESDAIPNNKLPSFGKPVYTLLKRGPATPCGFSMLYLDTRVLNRATQVDMDVDANVEEIDGQENAGFVEEELHRRVFFYF